MAIYYNDIDQGSSDWFNLRMGIPTASEFKKIITPKTMKLSSQAYDYAILKLAEIMTGEYQGIQEPTYYMERGKLLENEAIEAYEFTNDVKVQRIGFVTTDDKAFGASPDFLVGENGCGENKCLKAENHLKYLLKYDEIKSDHMPQVQGQLYIAEREWCDWNIYHPTLPRHSVRIYRDEVYIKQLANCLNEFRDMMNEFILTLQSRDQWIIGGNKNGL